MRSRGDRAWKSDKRTASLTDFTGQPTGISGQSPLLSSPGGTVGLAWTLLGVNTTYSLFINVCGWPTRACLYGCGYVCVCGGGGEC